MSFIDIEYLELVVRDHLHKRVRDMSKRELCIALRREAGIAEEGPSIAEFCLSKGDEKSG